MKTIINIKADKEVKQAAVKVAEEMGLPLSTIVNAFLKQFIAERRVSFFAPLHPSKKLQNILKNADKDINQGKNLVGPFATGQEMINHLNS